MPDMTQAVVALVVPLFKHSVLVVDALASAVAQRCRVPLVVIVVNDGCPYAESDLQVKSVLAAHPDLIRYVVRKNGGLSAARNTGIDYALAHYPALEAIYFLDADNVLRPTSIDSAYARLVDNPRSSWVYPNIDMFGIGLNSDYSGDYSLLRNLLFNICEAGSLVHRRVFDAGVRFDEHMKLGYEDWEFWVSAAAHGFRGIHNPYFGLLYRNRAESMLAQSKRHNAEIVAYIQRKHAGLFGKKTLLRLAARETPRHAIVCFDTDEAALTNGLQGDTTWMTRREFEALLWRNLTVPSWQNVPPLLVFTTRAVLEELHRLVLLPGALFECECALAAVNFAGIMVERRRGNAVEVTAGGTPRDADLLVINRDIVRSIVGESGTEWVEQIQTPDPQFTYRIKRLLIPGMRPGAAAPGRMIAASFLLWVYGLRASPYVAAAKRQWIWRQVVVPPVASLTLPVRDLISSQPIYPFAPTAEYNIGFVVPIANFGGVERVTYRIAEQFQRAGWRPHLFVVGSHRVELLDGLCEVMASINFINGDGLGEWEATVEFLGSALPRIRGNPAAAERLVAALGWLDAVVNCQSPDLNVVAASLRHIGMPVATHVHLLDRSPYGRPEGHGLLTLAYEHAYDLVLCTSQGLMHWLSAAGIPREKLLHVPNAPGHVVPAAERERILAARRHEGGHLNILYAGRLDRQKGIQRLAAVIERTLEMGLDVEWRVVGAPVMFDQPLPPALADLVEPPVFASEAMTAMLAWADVLVLLSDYEGVPLSILEARHCGVVVIATNVGGVAEIIVPGANGFLVSLDGAVEETVDILIALASAPHLRARIAGEANSVLDWERAAGELVERMNSLVAVRRLAEPPADLEPAPL